MKIADLKIGTKLVGGFLVVSILVAVCGVAGIIMVSNVNSELHTISHERLPIKDVSMEAVIALITGRDAAAEYLLNTEGLEEIAGEIEMSISRFEMWTSMVRYGTESEEFRSKVPAEMYTKDGHGIVSPQGSQEMIALAEEADKYHAILIESARTLVKNHNERVKYNFYYEGKNWDFVNFLNLVELQHKKWLEQLNEAAASNTAFTGETDPTKCFFGRWYYAYMIDDG
ncbi:MAG: MCP four helix bundle domain-containing protein, partial [Spirochaetota bacterium]